MPDSNPAWAHGPIQEIFPELFFVTGTNKVTHDGQLLQHSRNMIIIRNKQELNLINAVRLTVDGLVVLSQLGTVKNVLRIGSFHGRDDAFYQKEMGAKLWELPGMPIESSLGADYIMEPDAELPFQHAKLLPFPSSRFPEAIIWLDREGGILVTCDSIKNWQVADEFFSQSTAALYQQQSFFGTATISSIWLEAMKVKQSDFDKILGLPFKHLISAHGQPLLNRAKEELETTVKNIVFY